MISISFWWFCSVAACTLSWHWFWSSLLKNRTIYNANQAKSVKDSNFASSFTDFASHFFCFVEFIRLLKGVWSKIRKGRNKVAVLNRLCLICIVDTILIWLLKSKSIILSTHYNKIEFWILPIRSRRSSKHRWNLHHLLSQPIPTKHARNPIRKKDISFSNYSIFIGLAFKKKNKSKNK